MTVYELIQELTEFDGDSLVEISVELHDVEIDEDETLHNLKYNTVKINYKDTTTSVEVASVRNYGDRRDDVLLKGYFN